MRFLEYVARLYEKVIPLEERYRQKTVPLPIPEFYVFYNGNTDYPAEKMLKLSDAFKNPCAELPNLEQTQQNTPSENRENFPLELCVKVYNINKRSDVPFVQNCTTLEGYAKLADYANEARKAGRSDYLDFAIQRCISEGILADYLKRNSTEVRNMLIADYDYDTDIRVKKQEAYEEGISQGIAQQKAEDEKILQESVSQISAQKDEINRLLEEIARLKAERTQ